MLNSPRQRRLRLRRVERRRRRSAVEPEDDEQRRGDDERRAGRPDHRADVLADVVTPPTSDGTRTVVSESGVILSPK